MYPSTICTATVATLSNVQDIIGKARGIHLTMEICGKYIANDNGDCILSTVRAQKGERQTKPLPMTVHFNHSTLMELPIGIFA